MLEAKNKDLIFRIEEVSKEYGVYLFVFKNDKCIKDYLQQDIKSCQKQALNVYGVPYDSWNESVKMK